MPQEPKKMEKTPEQLRWEALLRGQVMSATVNKFTVILRMIDQKAQVMIFLNSLLIPICIRTIEEGSNFRDAAMVSVFTSIISILASIICIYPKRRYRKYGHRDLNLLHFNDIGHMSKEDYLSQFLPIFNDTSKLAEAAACDLYDTSRYSIIPKFVWLKFSYAVFALGNILAIVMAFMGM